MVSSTLPPDLAAARILNAAGTLTRLSGARVALQVAGAMAEAAGQSFDMWQLQAAASARIAAATGAEAGLVTTGAAAGLTLAAAAAIASRDLARMERLPDTSAMPNEIIVPRTHRNAYDRALRVAGAHIIDVGVADRETGAGIRGHEAWEIEAAITPRTVALAASASAATEHDIPMMADVARRHGLKLIVDAAAQLPPVENLRRPIKLGASLVVYSGGKAIGGPQASGILAGERSLIASAALQMLDMDVRPESFVPPAAFFGNERPPALPRHGLGRGYKASKEAIIGLMVALEAFPARDFANEAATVELRLRRIAGALAALSGVSTTLLSGRLGSLPRLQVCLEPISSAGRMVAALRCSMPPVFVAEGRISDGALIIDLLAVTSAEDEMLIDALLAAARAAKP